ncbi:MAG: hypothetical protein ACOYBC_00940, partial [Bilifractor sp.]
PAHPASFGSHLAMGTLAFGYVLPTTGRTLDFHQLGTCAAGRTKPKIPASLVNDLQGYSYLYNCSYSYFTQIQL